MFTLGSVIREGSKCIRGCFKDRVGRVPIGQISVDSGCSRRAFMFCLVCLKHLPLLNTWNIFDVSMFHYKSRRVIRSFWGLCPIPLVLRIHDVSNSFDQQQLILQRSSAPGQGYVLCPFLQQHATPWKKKTLKILSHRFHSFKLKDSKLHVSKTEFYYTLLLDSTLIFLRFLCVETTFLAFEPCHPGLHRWCLSGKAGVEPRSGSWMWDFFLKLRKFRSFRLFFSPVVLNTLG